MEKDFNGMNKGMYKFVSLSKPKVGASFFFVKDKV